MNQEYWQQIQDIASRSNNAMDSINTINYDKTCDGEEEAEIYFLRAWWWEEKKTRVKTGEMGSSTSRILFFMTKKIINDNRNGLITSNFFRFDVMISSLAKVMGLESRQKQGPKFVYPPRTYL